MNKLCIAVAALMLLAGIEGARAFLLLGGGAGPVAPTNTCRGVSLQMGSTLSVQLNPTLQVDLGQGC